MTAKSGLIRQKRLADHRGEAELGDEAEVALFVGRGRIDDDNAVDELGRLLGEGDGDGAAERVTDDLRVAHPSLPSASATRSAWLETE